MGGTHRVGRRAGRPERPHPDYEPGYAHGHDDGYAHGHDDGYETSHGNGRAYGHGEHGGGHGGGNGHSHGHGPPPPLPDGRQRQVRIVLAVTLVPFFIATVAGLVLLWPGGHRHQLLPQYQAGNGRAIQLVDATVATSARGPCGGAPQTGPDAAKLNLACVATVVLVTSGPDNGRNVTIESSYDPAQPVLHPDDKVRLGRSPDGGGHVTYFLADFQRGLPLGWIALVFAIAVVAVARWRGLAAIAGLGLTYLVLVRFMLPALLDGRSPVAVALTGCAALLFAVLYLAHGVSARTSTALLGTLVSLALTGALAAGAIDLTRLTGLGSDASTELKAFAGHLSLTGLILAGLLIGSLGLLNDVTITQASAVWELAALSPDASPLEIYRSAMRVGRDHIASSVYTIVLAYAGASLPTLLLFTLSGRSTLDVLTGDDVAAEIVRTLVGGIGLVASVPVTTGIAALAVTRLRPGQRAARDRGGVDERLIRG